MNSNFLLTTFEMRTDNPRKLHVRHINVVKCVGWVLCILLSSAGCAEVASEARLDKASVASNVSYADFEKTARVEAKRWSAKQVNSTIEQPDPSTFVHPDAPFEFWVYLAILKDEQGQHYAFQQRFARLRLHSQTQTVFSNVSADTPESASDPIDFESAWQYSDVIAMDYRFDLLASKLSANEASEDKVSRSFTQVQRVALELSGADASTQTIWIGGFSARNASTSFCQPDIELQSPGVTLHFSQAAPINDCESQLVKLDRFTSQDSLSMSVNGSFIHNAKSVYVNGSGWIIRGWGVPPDVNNAAVVFDRGWFLLNDQTELLLQRSKRASGRGQAITTGTLQSLETANSDALVGKRKLNGELIDVVNDLSENALLSFELNSAENALALQLKAIASGGQANQSSQASSWFGVVAVEGSHSGYGFIDYNAAQ